MSSKSMDAFTWFVRGETLVIPPATENGSALLLPFVIPLPQFSLTQITGGLLITLTGLFGVLTNLINMRVFLSIGLGDGITASFLGLSTSDFMFSVFSVVWGLTSFLFGYEVSHGITFSMAPEIIRKYSANGSQVFYTVTVLNTVYIAVAKFCCVVTPILFKSLFTVQKSLVFTCLCSIALIALYVPFIFASSTVEKFVEHWNISRIVWNIEKWKPYRANLGIATHSVIPLVAQTTITLCTAGMVWGLRNASQFRQTSLGENNSPGAKPDGKIPETTSRERRVLRQVIFLCTVFLVCNTPRVALRMVELKLSWTKTEPQARFQRVLAASQAFLKQLPACVNGCINIVIYIKFNRKFRHIFREQIPCLRCLVTKEDV